MKLSELLSKIELITINKHQPGIYIIFSIINEKTYVGQTKQDFNKRWHQHCYRLKQNKKANNQLQNIYNKYGKDNLKFLPIENCCIDQLSEREAYYIELLKEYCINEAPVGKSFNASPEYKKAQSERMKKYYQANPEKINKGIRMESKKYWDSEEGQTRKLQQSIERKGKKFAPMKEEQKERLREARLGTSLSEETKQKISRAGKGRKHSPEAIQKMKDRAIETWRKRKEILS